MSPVATPQRARHEPEENELVTSTLINALLTVADDAMRSIKANGGEAAIRAIFEKHFPAPVAPKSEVLPEASKAPQPATGATVSKPAPSYDIELMLGLSNAAYRLDDHARRAKPGSANQNADAACAAFLHAEIAKLKGGTPA